MFSRLATPVQCRLAKTRPSAPVTVVLGRRDGKMHLAAARWKDSFVERRRQLNSITTVFWDASYTTTPLYSQSSV